MLREEPKPAPRVRICGDLARYLDEEDLLALQEPAVAALEPQAVVTNLCLMEDPEEMQAA